MEFAYKKLIEQHKIDISKLPEEALIGIETIKNIQKSITMLEKRPGGNPAGISPKTLAKIKANDKWIVNEILDYLDSQIP
jgi:hypothetical protein